MSNTDTSINANAIVPPPPRLTGNYAADQVTIADWFQAFYNAAVTESGLLDPTFQSSEPTINPNSLPDPTNTNIAGAQLVANLAYQFCQAINAQLAAAGVTGFPISEPI